MMKTKLNRLFSMITITLLMISCQDNKPTASPKPTTPVDNFTKCSEPRPQVCTRDFRPVCGQVDTGVRCVTTPCPSTEKKTFSNACTACADPKVHGYWLNACPK